MSDLLRPLPLAELLLSAQGRRWRVSQRIAGLDSLTPVHGVIKALHHGTALEVTAEAETIVTLCCDRCLQHYNHPLRAEVHELVELRGQADPAAACGHEELNLELAREGMPEGADLDDRLDPAGDFDPERWLFEQLSLRLPLVNRCGDDCPGPARWSSEPAAGDPRWAALARLGLGGEASPNANGEESAATQTATTSEPGPSIGPLGATSSSCEPEG
jgi:uncharacterized protein